MPPIPKLIIQTFFCQLLVHIAPIVQSAYNEVLHSSNEGRKNYFRSHRVSSAATRAVRELMPL